MKKRANFIRFFFKESYITYSFEENIFLTIGKNCDINLDIEQQYYLKIENKHLSTNLNLDSKLEINLVYNLCELDCAFKIGQEIEPKYISLTTNSLQNIFKGKVEEIIIDYTNNELVFNEEIYIAYKLYTSGKFYYGKSILVCIRGVEFVIENDSIIISEYTDFSKVSFYENEVNINIINSLKLDFQYDFKYDFDYIKFSEKLSKYVVSPLVIIISMSIMSFVLKRPTMIVFMLISSLSSVITSTLMYLNKKSGAKDHNLFVDYDFTNSLIKLDALITNEIKQYYQKINFSLIQLNGEIGYSLNKCYQISNKIKSEKFKSLFEQYENNLVDIHIPYKIDFTHFKISVIGVYANRYVDNLLLQLLEINSFSARLVIIGVISNKYKWLGNVLNLVHLSSLDEVRQFDFNSNVKTIYLVNNLELIKSANLYEVFLITLSSSSVIYQGIVNVDAQYVIEVNDDFKHKLLMEDYVFTSKFIYAKIVTNHNHLAMLYRNICSRQNLVLNSYEPSIEINTSINLSATTKLDFTVDGPHGLIIGMTGSGKSVLLETIIYEICLKNHPSQAVFAVIDFKGNALINQVKTLPHFCAGYSNLDGNYETIIESIENELNFRQNLFNNLGISEFKELANQESLPKLFIIIDEFAEVKSKSTEIIDKIISVARLGRSLGIFLILALQKSSGIINEQLKSNLGYIIALKVNSLNDSMDAIECDKAYYQNNPGEAIIKIGTRYANFKVFNYNDNVVDAIQINGENTSNISYKEKTKAMFEKTYSKTEYVVWKEFNKSGSGIILNDPRCKNLIKYNLSFNSYLIMGKTSSGKSNLVNIILNSSSTIRFTLSNNKLFVSNSDNFTSNIDNIELLISFAKTFKNKLYFVIDDLELFISEKLNTFILEICNGKYSNIRVVITCKSSSMYTNKYAKLISNKFLLSVEDKSEVYNLFYKKSNTNIINIGEGICEHDNKLIHFKSYLEKYLLERKKFNISNLSGYYYLDTFEKVSLNNAFIIYDELPSNIDTKYIYNPQINNIVLPLYIHYTHVVSSNLNLMKMLDSGNIFTLTDKLEYKYTKFKVKENMLYDCTNHRDVINICKVIL